MEYRLKGGATLGDADFERMADEAERGEYPGTPGEWVVRPQCRPALDGGELVKRHVQDDEGPEGRVGQARRKQG